MADKPKRKGKPTPRYLIWLTGTVAVVWGIALAWGYTSYGTVTKSISSTMSYEEIAAITAENFVMLGTDVPYCDYAAEVYISSVLAEEDVKVALMAVPGIEAVTITYNRGDCFIRPEAGERAAMIDRYVRSQVIEITAEIDDSDLARGNLLYAVFNALMPLMPTEPEYNTFSNTYVRISFADGAGTERYTWGRSYDAGINAIEMYDRATIWQQTR